MGLNLSSNKQILLNIFSAVLVFLLTLLINFFLSPFIIRNLGEAANGFIQLSTQVVSYFAIISMSLNSMTARFITVATHKGNHEEAGKYFSSTYGGNLILTLVLIIPVTLGIIFVNYLINIPNDLLSQVQILLFFVFFNYFLGLIFPPWGTIFFVVNRMYISSLGNIISNLIRALIIVLAFVFFPTKIWYIGTAATFSTAFMIVWQYYWKKKLLPTMRFEKDKIDFQSVKQLIFSGIWNSVNQLGVILFNSIDLLLINLFFGPEMMGILSIAKIIPMTLDSLRATIMQTFAPNLTILFAQDKKQQLKDEIFKTGKILLVLTGIPFSGFIAFGQLFFRLWLPEQDGKFIYILSVVSISNLLFVLGISPLWSLFVVVNKNKEKALSVLYSGIGYLLLAFLFLSFTSVGIYVILGISSSMAILKDIVFTIPYSAKYLGFKWTTFFPLIGHTLLVLAINYGIGIAVTTIFYLNNWIHLGIAAFFFAIISLTVNSLVVLKSEERKLLVNKLLKR